MPADFTLAQLPGGIELRDSLGVMFQRIVVSGEGDVAPMDSAGVSQLRGKWESQGLEAESTGPRGGTLHESYELADGGKTLKIVTKVLFPGPRPPLEFTRTYVRAAGS